MDSDFLPTMTPVQVGESLLVQEDELREIAKDLRPGGHFEARCLVSEAADKLLEARRALAAEMPGRPPARPAARPDVRPALRVAN